MSPKCIDREGLGRRRTGTRHCRPESLLGAWARGTVGSGDTGFEVLDFRTSGHFWFSTMFLIAFTCSCRSVNDCKFRWFKAFKRESSNLLLNRKWPEVLKSRTSNPVSPEPPVLVLRPPGGSGDENGTRYERAQKKTYHYPDLGSTSDWSCPAGKFASTNHKYYPDLLVAPHQYGISEHCNF